MSPEQIMAKRGGVDSRTDIYSMGVTLYQLLANKPPFSGTSTQEILNQILESEPKPPRRQVPESGAKPCPRHRLKVPKALSIIAMKAMEKAPAARFQSCGEMAEELRRYLRGSSIVSRPTSLFARLSKRIRKHKVLSVLAAAIIILIIGFFIERSRSSREIKQTSRELSAAEKDLEYNKNLSSADRLLAHPSIGMNLSNAINLLTETIKLNPDRPDAHISLAKAFILQGNPARALEEFNKAVLCAPDSCEVLLERALFLLDQGRLGTPEKAIYENAIYLGFSDLSKAMEMDQSNPTIAYHMAKTLYDCSNASDLGFEQSRSIITYAYNYARKAQAFESTADVECLLGQIFFEFARYATSETEKLTNLNRALEGFRKALVLDGNHNLAFHLKAEVERMINEPEQTSGEVDTRRIVEELGLGDYLDSAENIYNELKTDFDKSLSDTEKTKLLENFIAFLLSPDPITSIAAREAEAAFTQEEGLDYETLIEKALDFMEQKDYLSAIKCYQKCLILNPARAHDLNYRIGEAYFTQGTEKELGLALQHSRLAYSQEPKNGGHLSLLAKILLKLGDIGGLKKLYGEAKKNGTLFFFPWDLPFLKGEEEKNIPR